MRRPRARRIAEAGKPVSSWRDVAERFEQVRLAGADGRETARFDERDLASILRQRRRADSDGVLVPLIEGHSLQRHSPLARSADDQPTRSSRTLPGPVGVAGQHPQAPPSSPRSRRTWPAGSPTAPCGPSTPSSRPRTTRKVLTHGGSGFIIAEKLRGTDHQVVETRSSRAASAGRRAPRGQGRTSAHRGISRGSVATRAPFASDIDYGRFAAPRRLRDALATGRIVRPAAAREP
jgi:hypothetical protein